MITKDYGFIILRNVNNPLQNMMWIECCNCIRKFYDNKIVIIDDNSNDIFVSEIELKNVEIIKSEFKGRGEFLPYYYMITRKLFDKVVILHDSMFLNKPLYFEIENVKFLWHSSTHKHNKPREINNSFHFLNHKKKNKLRKMHKNTKNWWPCFGCSVVVKLSFLLLIQENYNLLNLRNFVKDRKSRMVFERTLAIIFCICEKNLKKENISIFGNIHKYGKKPFKYSFIDYLNEKNKKELELPIYKSWTGR